jgi:hypothetical protein
MITEILNTSPYLQLQNDPLNFINTIQDIQDHREHVHAKKTIPKFETRKDVLIKIL